MTTRERGFWMGAVVAAIVLCVVVGVAVASRNSQSATCPDWQSLKVSSVNGDQFNNNKPPPPGAHYSDSVSGSGLDYTLNSDNDSATLKVHGKGTATLEIACR